MTFSDQALSCVMVALQKSLMEESDIVPMLRDFNFVVTDSGQLEVTNPPKQILFQEE